jgi:signal transduction histidine kinase
VRSRATIVAVIVVAVALAAGTFGLLTLTSDRIESSTRDAAIARAQSLGALIEAGALEDPLPGLDPELFAQVVDSSGEVVASDRAISGVPAVASIAVAPGEQLVLTLDDILEGFEDEAAGLEDQGPYAVVALGVTLPGGPGSVIVAASLEDAAQARNAVLPLLGIGLPLLLILVGLTVWILTGRALHPVEEMSAEAGRISALALDRRLPLPIAKDELHHLAATLNDMLERLEEAAVKQRRFVADASHELKSPLASMRTMVEVAARDGSVDAEVVADLSEEVTRMQGLVTDLLFLAQHEESHRPDRMEEVDLDQVVMSTASAVRRAGGIEVDTSGIGPVRVMGDSSRLMQLVRNLTENAVRHAETTVWVETVVAGGRAKVTVSDDGPGVPADEAERIFERFVRLDESRARDTGGSGLGLAVARAIARDHGGDVVVGSPRHGGATFEAWIPGAAE